MARKSKNDVLKEFRKQVEAYIAKNYRTVEEFCWDNDLSKATVSNLLNDKKDFTVSTLEKIAFATKSKVKVTIE